MDSNTVLGDGLTSVSCRDPHFIINMDQSSIPFIFDRQCILELVGSKQFISANQHVT